MDLIYSPSPVKAISFQTGRPFARSLRVSSLNFVRCRRGEYSCDLADVVLIIRELLNSAVSSACARFQVRLLWPRDDRRLWHRHRLHCGPPPRRHALRPSRRLRATRPRRTTSTTFTSSSPKTPTGEPSKSGRSCTRCRTSRSRVPRRRAGRRVRSRRPRVRSGRPRPGRRRRARGRFLRRTRPACWSRSRASR